mgnify:CR=1 FL=1
MRRLVIVVVLFALAFSGSGICVPCKVQAQTRRLVSFFVPPAWFSSRTVVENTRIVVEINNKEASFIADIYGSFVEPDGYHEDKNVLGVVIPEGSSELILEWSEVSPSARHTVVLVARDLSTGEAFGAYALAVFASPGSMNSWNWGSAPPVLVDFGGRTVKIWFLEKKNPRIDIQVQGYTQFRGEELYTDDASTDGNVLGDKIALLYWPNFDCWGNPVGDIPIGTRASVLFFYINDQSISAYTVEGHIGSVTRTFRPPGIRLTPICPPEKC